MADIFRIPDTVEEMTLDLLNKYITKHQAMVTERYQPLWDAYINKYKILTESDENNKKDTYKPDHRIAVNFASYTTNVFEGFFLGNPIKITSDDEAVSEYINYLDAYNDQDNGNAELSRLVSIFGRAYEMYYTDEEGVECIAHLSPMDAFMIFDESIKCRPRYFVRLYTDEETQVTVGSISDRDNVQYFSFQNGLHWTSEPDPHNFIDVPATEYTQNEARRGLFEDVLNIIDEFNEAISEKANDVDSFSDAILHVDGVELSEEQMQRTRDRRVLNTFGGNGSDPITAKFLGRPNADVSQEHFLDRTMDLIFIISMVVNLQDDSFATTSGTALKYKMSNMYNLFKSKERRFTSGLTRRYKILFSNPVCRLPDDSWTSITYTFTPNMPIDIEGEATAVSNLTGITSRKLQLQMLSAVQDVDKELAQIAKEQDETAYDTDYPTSRTDTDDGGDVE